MEQVFESQNFLLKVDESCQSACLQVKNLDEFKDEAELKELLQRAGVRQEDLLRCKSDGFGKDFPLAKRAATKAKEVDYLLEKDLDYVKKDSLLASVSFDGQRLCCFGDKDFYVQKFVNEHFLGDNTYYKNGGIFAGKDGCPYQDEKHRLNVRDKFTIEKDLVQEVEEPFYGDLEVFGNVLNSKIEVVGKLVVHGSICASRVKVHDILVVHKNVMEGSFVEVRKDASLAAATGSTLICGGNIFFGTGLSDCKIVCEKSVVSDSSVSVIKSGSVELGDFLICANVGNSVDLPMSLSIGVLPYSKYRLEELSKQYYAKAEKNAEIASEIARFDRRLEDAVYRSYDLRQVEEKFLRISGILHQGVEIAIYNLREVVQAREKGVELAVGEDCIIKRDF